MHILDSILKKMGKKYEDLSPMAKDTFNRWQTVLNNTKAITPKELAIFLKGENDVLVDQLCGYDTTFNSEIDRNIKAQIKFSKFIISLVETPEKAASNLETYLKHFYKL